MELRSNCLRTGSLKNAVFKGWPESGKSGPGGARGLRSNCVRTGSLKNVVFEGWPETGKSGPGGTRGSRSNCVSSEKRVPLSNKMQI